MRPTYSWLLSAHDKIGVVLRHIASLCSEAPLPRCLVLASTSAVLRSQDQKSQVWISNCPCRVRLESQTDNSA